MSAPIGRRDFFAIEAADYLERLGVIVTATDADGEEFVRYARALRGAALMAGPPGYSAAAAALENLARATRDGTLTWTPILADRVADTLEECRTLLRQVREWSDTDTDRCERLAAQLDSLAGPAARRPAARDSASGHPLAPSVRAFVAREAAGVAGVLEMVADAVESDPRPDTADPLIRRLQPLRGLGALPGLSPVPELLDAVDLTITTAGRGGAWPPGAGRALRAAAAALGQLAREVADQGSPTADAPEVRRAAALLREAFAGDDDVVPISSLFVEGDPDPVVSRGTPPAAAEVTSGFTVELVSLADRLRQAADQATAATGSPARDLLLFALVITIRGLAMSPIAGSATGQLFCRVDREIMTGRAGQAIGAFAGVLRRAADAIAQAGESESVAALASRLQPLCEELDRLAGPPPPREPEPVPMAQREPVPEPEPSPAPEREPEPEPEPEPVPIESLLAATGFNQLERSFSTLFRLLHPVPAPAPAPAPGPAAALPALDTDADVMPIEQLLYRGRRALERADVVRQALHTTLRTNRNLDAVEELLNELLDLVPLALDDER